MGGALEALAANAAACESLAALDLGFATGLTDDEALRRVVGACSHLTRCSLRGAKRVSGDLYNHIVGLMQQRSGQAEHAQAFYYLKR